MEGPPLGPGGEDITWPDQVAPRGRKASSTRKIKPQTSNLETPSDMGATHCPSQPMVLRPILVILRAQSQMEYAIRHTVLFNSKTYANI